jgi:AcrR family transcriptional regulator
VSSKEQSLKDASAERPDRRVQRTQRSLREAMLSLLLERSWDEITVRHICERADIGRSTFYTRYDNKEQLLASGLDDLRVTLQERARASGASKPPPMAFLRGLIEHAHEQRQLFRTIVGRRSAHLVQLRFKEMVLRLVKDEFAAYGGSAWERAGAAHFIAGALVETLGWWSESSSKHGPDEFEAFFLRLAGPAIAPLPSSKAIAPRRR